MKSYIKKSLKRSKRCMFGLQWPAGGGKSTVRRKCGAQFVIPTCDVRRSEKKMKENKQEEETRYSQERRAAAKRCITRHKKKEVNRPG